MARTRPCERRVSIVAHCPRLRRRSAGAYEMFFPNAEIFPRLSMMTYAGSVCEECLDEGGRGVGRASRGFPSSTRPWPIIPAPTLARPGRICPLGTCAVPAMRHSATLPLPLCPYATLPPCCYATMPQRGWWAIRPDKNGDRTVHPLVCEQEQVQEELDALLPDYSDAAAAVAAVLSTHRRRLSTPSTSSTRTRFGM